MFTTSMCGVSVASHVSIVPSWEVAGAGATLGAILELQ